MCARASCPVTVSTTRPRTSAIPVGVVALPDRHRHAGIALDRLELRAVHLGVDQHVVVVGVDPHHVRHRLTRREDDRERREVGRLRELANARARGLPSGARGVHRLVGVDAVGQRARDLQPELRASCRGAGRSRVRRSRARAAASARSPSRCAATARGARSRRRSCPSPSRATRRPRAAHLDLALDDDEELACRARPRGSARCRRDLALLAERGDAPQVALRAELEERQVADQLDLRVGAEEHGGHTLDCVP